MKTVAIMACCDTKQEEALFLSNFIRKHHLNTLILDISLGPNVPRTENSISREELVAAAGTEWKSLLGKKKHELMSAMMDGVRIKIPSLYQEGRFDGIICIGGLQNTTIGAAALQALPIGVPKFIVSTVATGAREFGSIVGSKDITIMPSLSDFSGMNVISQTVLENAGSAMIGMVQYAGTPLRSTDRFLVGATLMGANNDMATRAVGFLQAAGKEVVSFHSTGAGGRLLEEFVEAGVISAVMDLSLHETVYEFFGNEGFGKGSPGRLIQGAAKGIPMVVCPGCIDFMCINPEDFKNDRFIKNGHERKYIWHNPSLAHVKLSVEEAVGVANLIVSRINQSTGEVRVLLPESGLRSLSHPGEPLYDPDVDYAIAGVFEDKLRSDIPLIRYNGNFDDEEFSYLCAETMLELIKDRR